MSRKMFINFTGCDNGASVCIKTAKQGENDYRRGEVLIREKAGNAPRRRRGVSPVLKPMPPGGGKLRPGRRPDPPPAKTDETLLKRPPRGVRAAGEAADGQGGKGPGTPRDSAAGRPRSGARATTRAKRRRSDGPGPPARNTTAKRGRAGCGRTPALMSTSEASRRTGSRRPAAAGAARRPAGSRAASPEGARRRRLFLPPLCLFFIPILASRSHAYFMMDKCLRQVQGHSGGGLRARKFLRP